MNLTYRVFIDFDGTMTAGDVGYELFRNFTHGATESTVAAYRRGKINSLECLSRECAIKLYESLGFIADGGPQESNPAQDSRDAVPARYIRMILG